MNEYKVVSNGDGTYSIFYNDVVIQNAHVQRIYFPESKSHTLHGEVHHISGCCKAEISIPEIGDFSGVSVEFK